MKHIALKVIIQSRHLLQMLFGKFNLMIACAEGEHQWISTRVTNFSGTWLRTIRQYTCAQNEVISLALLSKYSRLSNRVVGGSYVVSRLHKMVEAAMHGKKSDQNEHTKRCVLCCSLTWIVLTLYLSLSAANLFFILLVWFNFFLASHTVWSKISCPFLGLSSFERRSPRDSTSNDGIFQENFTPREGRPRWYHWAW